MTENHSSKTYIAGGAAILFILGLILLPSMFEDATPEPAANTSTPVKEVDIDALKTEGLQLLRQEEETGLGGESKNRLEQILVELPRLRDYYAEQKENEQKAAAALQKMKDAADKRIADAKQAVEDLWNAYDGRPLPKSILIRLNVQQLEELLGVRDYMEDGTTPDDCARHLAPLISYVGPNWEKLYDFTGTDSPADPMVEDDLKNRWQRCLATVTNDSLVALFQAELRYCKSLDYKPAFSADNDPWGANALRVSFARFGYDQDWSLEKSYCLKWINFDTSVYED